MMKVPLSQRVFAVFVLLGMLMVVGCTDSKEHGGAAEGDVAALPDQGAGGHYPIGYQEGLALAMRTVEGDAPGAASGTYPVYFVQAHQVDSEGKAGQWIFGVQKAGENYFVVVQSDRQVSTPYPFDLPGVAVTATSSVDPATLIGKNRQRFLDAGLREPILIPELELSAGYYTVTVPHGSANAVMVFDAATGNPVE